MTDDDSGEGGSPAPRLTIGQRLLAALPNLQRQPVPSAPRRQNHDDITAVEDDAVDAEVTPAPDEDDATPDVATTSVPAGLGGRLSALLNPSPAATRPRRPVDDLATMTAEEITHRIKRLDDRERFLALTSAPIGVAVGTLLTVFALHLNPAMRVDGKLNPKHVSDSLILLEGGVRIVLSGVVVACALTRRRSLVGFSLLFLGTAMGSPLFALPFWVLGGYLIWRVFKYQKILTARRSAARGTTRDAARGRAPGGGRVPANPRAAGRAGADAARQRVQSGGRRGRKEPAPTGPTPSKRYTPPRPTRPRPPAPPS